MIYDMLINSMLLLLLSLFIVCFSIYRERKRYRILNRLLDSVLKKEKLEYSDIKEGELSALVHKLGRIQEVLEKQVERAEEEREQIKSLVSNMSHELKTPLANLSIYAEILNEQEMEERMEQEIEQKIKLEMKQQKEQQIEQQKEHQKKRQIAEKIKNQVDKLDWIIGSLLKMIKLEQNVIVFHAEDNFIKKTIIDAVDLVYEKLERKELTLIFEPYEDCMLYHNRKWTTEVFVNILENAVKYTDAGGTIKIRLCPYEIYTEIQFIDNGCGIHEEEIMQIRKRFYRSQETAHIVEGSGIGLYLSDLILEKEKGYLVVKSTYGKGSCFSVFLQNCKK